MLVSPFCKKPYSKSLMRIKLSLLPFALLVMTQFPNAQETKVPSTQRILLGGGCFWSAQVALDSLKGKGVVSNIVGYSGGYKKNPTYMEVVAGSTGHREVVEVTYDPQIISLQQILATFWTSIDPLNESGQFCDKGEQYKSTIYYVTDEEKLIAEQSRLAAQKLAKIPGPFKTEILKAEIFYPAEDYHQDFYLKSKKRYAFYKLACRREKRLKEVWGN